MSIQSIIRWFETAKPEPTNQDLLKQIAFHFEEVAEMLEAMNTGDEITRFTHLRDEIKTVKKYLLDVSSYKVGSDVLVAGFDKVALLDACADQVVTSTGVAVFAGMDFEPALEEVDTSNWTKFALDEKGNPVPYIKPNGKIGKNPDTYQDPELEPFIDRKANQAKARERLKELVAMGDTPAPYTSKKITVERIVTEVETYEIHPEQLEAFIDCADHRLEIDFGKPTGEFYSDKRRVLTTGRIDEVNEPINGDQE